MTTKYTIAEHEAIKLVRRTMLTKPDIIKDIMKDMAYMSAFGVLHQAKDDMGQLLAVAQVFADAAKAIISQDKEYFNADH